MSLERMLEYESLDLCHCCAVVIMNLCFEMELSKENPVRIVKNEFCETYDVEAWINGMDIVSYFENVRK